MGGRREGQERGQAPAVRSRSEVARYALGLRFLTARAVVLWGLPGDRWGHRRQTDKARRIDRHLFLRTVRALIFDGAVRLLADSQCSPNLWPCCGTCYIVGM